MNPDPLPVTSLTVFCASRPHDVYGPQAEAFGRDVAGSGIHVIYGNGGSGLMGALAKGARAAGGSVTGVSPSGLFDNELPDTPAGVEALMTAGMHERKEVLYRLGDAFAVLPGGVGSMSEFWEALEWSQLRLHHRQPVKPLVLLNWDGYFDLLDQQLDQAVEHGFLGAAVRELVHVAHDGASALKELGVAVPEASAAVDQVVPAA